MSNKNPGRQLRQVIEELDKLELPYEGTKPEDDDVGEVRLKNEWKRLSRLKEQVADEGKRLESSLDELELNQKVIKDRESTLEAQESDLEARVEEADKRLEKLTEREAELVDRERSMSDREAQAKAGFAELNQSELEKLEAQRAELMESMEAERSQAIAEREQARQALRAELDALRQAAEGELSGQRTALEQRETALRSKEAALHRRETEVQQAKELLTVDQELWEGQKEREVTLRASDAESKARYFEEMLRTAEAERDDLAEQLRGLESKLRRLGDDPDGLVRELDQRRQDCTRLEDELAGRPTPSEAERLRAAAAERDDLLVDVENLRRANSDLDTALRRRQLEASEVQLVQDERDALEHQKEALRAAIRDLQDQLGELRDLEETKHPFPACTDIDNDPDLQRPQELCETIYLDDLAASVQGQMAKSGFYYELLDLQLFIAGLATSRLHLLQGISGTGKTSLPVQFAKAISGGSRLIEIQAGWRDRDDLLGYYNAFEGRFYESEFTKALYRSGTPRWAQRPVFIVLDEMNLSHPEQYFGLMLSKLESAHTGDANIELVSHPLNSTPERFINGAEIPWPHNVWFIGTANHDETTVTFADKTYDRAHVQELPAQHEIVRSSQRWDEEALSVDALLEAFDIEAEQHRAEGETVIEHFRTELAPVFRRLNVGWGNRIDKQIMRFVPVAVACGASRGDAADHVLATKIVRKVRDRHDLTSGLLEGLRDRIVDGWSNVSPSEPTATIRALDEEIRRLSGDLGDWTLD